MNHPYIKPVFITYLLVMSVIAFFGNNKYSVHAEEIVEEVTVVQSKVYQLEMNIADYEEIKKDILQKDVKYIAYPETFDNDVQLSEIVLKDIDYASEEAQRVQVEVIRYTNSKEEKQVVDTLTGEAVIHFSDTIAPEITLSETSIEFDEGEDFDPSDYVESLTDNSFGDIDLDIDNPVDTDEPGEYTVVYTATDASKNSSTANLTVTVNEVEEEEEEVEEEVVLVEETKSNENTPAAQGAPVYTESVSGSSVASAALAQIGVIQDCTMLVTNALRSVGINFHSAPAGYMSLGTIVSAAEAQAGDIIYYDDGGAGVPHVAIYIGGGQAVHGGWLGNQTVIGSAYVGTGPVFIRLH